MSSLDWMYHRAGCTSCAKAQDFLDKRKIEAAEVVNAKKIRIGLDEAIKLASKANEIYVLKGTKVVHVDLESEKPDRESFGKLLMGPSGNLRAPTILKGDTLVVGFHQETYEKVLEKN
jgi:arsenate reductase-like glutaredoxin family protein